MQLLTRLVVPPCSLAAPRVHRAAVKLVALCDAVGLRRGPGRPAACPPLLFRSTTHLPLAAPGTLFDLHILAAPGPPPSPRIPTLNRPVPTPCQLAFGHPPLYPQRPAFLRAAVSLVLARFQRMMTPAAPPAPPLFLSRPPRRVRGTANARSSPRYNQCRTRFVLELSVSTNPCVPVSPYLPKYALVLFYCWRRLVHYFRPAPDWPRICKMRAPEPHKLQARLERRSPHLFISPTPPTHPTTTSVPLPLFVLPST